VFNRHIKSKQEWDDFRWECFTSGMLSGSDYPMMWGHGYETLNIYVNRFINNEKKTGMDQKALDWGTENEKKVVDFLLENFYTIDYSFELDTEIWSSRDGYKAVITPDGIIRNASGKCSIVEIKCPYFWKLGEKPNKLEHTVSKFQLKYPFGSEKYFLQAAFYSTIKNLDSFVVLVHWREDDNDHITGVFEYKNTVSLKSVIMDGFREFTEIITSVKESGTKKRYIVKKAKKDKITRLMCDCLVYLDYMKSENSKAPEIGQIHQGNNVEFLPLEKK